MGFAGVRLFWTAEVREFGGIDSGKADVYLIIQWLISIQEEKRRQTLLFYP